MPAVRFSRDKRGYEYVYLVHTPIKRGRAGRSRVLYWYRTPPGVRIGRKPFDEDVQRLLERQNPGVSFDWEAIIGTPMPPPDMTEFWRERRKAERAARQERRAEEAGESPETPSPERAATTGPAPALSPAPVAAVEAPVNADEETVGPPPVVEASPAVDRGPGEERSDESTVRKKRRRRGGRRRKGAVGASAPTSAGDGPTASDAPDSTDEELDDPSGDGDSTSEGE